MATINLAVNTTIQLTPEELISAARGNPIHRPALTVAANIEPNQIASLFLSLNAEDRAQVFNELAGRCTDLEKPLFNYVGDILASGQVIPQARDIIVSKAAHPAHSFRAGQTVRLLVGAENPKSGFIYSSGDTVQIKWLDLTGENLVLLGDIRVHYTEVEAV